MQFWVKLIEVCETDSQKARRDLQSNCTHVAKDFWLFEGTLEALHSGIRLNLVGEEAIESYGDLTGIELRRMVSETYDVAEFEED